MNRNRNQAKWWKRAIFLGLYGLLALLVSIPGFAIVFFNKMPAPALPTWRYSQFVEEVEHHQVEAVRLTNDRSQALVTTRDKSKVLVYLPSDPNLINILAQNRVDIYAVPSVNEPTPFAGVSLLTLLVMIFTVSLLWVWSLVDCATHEARVGNTKTAWILIIIFTGWLGALLYVFVRRPQRLRAQ